jgi:hypothetical protein
MLLFFTCFRPTLMALFAYLAGMAAALAQTNPAKSETSKGTQPEKAPNFAFLCLNTNADPKSDVLKSKLVSWLQLDSPDKLRNFQIGRRKEATVTTFDLDTKSITIGRIDSPIPKDDIAYACANSAHWPQAAEKLGSHKGHLNVTVYGQFRDGLDLALFVSRVVAACTEAYDTAGIYWGHATIVHSPEFFLEQIKDSNRVDIPIFAWIGFLESPSKDPEKFDLYTRGLDVFGLMEIEVIGMKQKPAEIVPMVAELIDQLLKNGNVIKDGHTIPTPSGEKISVRHANSVLGREGKVLRIEF